MGTQRRFGKRSHGTPRRRARLFRPSDIGIALAVFGVFAGTQIADRLPAMRDLPFADQFAQPAPSGPLTGSIDRRFSICSSASRFDCVVDGDTLWIAGEKVRIADINTPELSTPECAAERDLAIRARDRLHALVNAGPIEIRAADRDEDRYGRKLRTLHRDGRSLGDALVAEGLAHRWQGRREGWCA
jgi:micrococcal nuclease